MHKTQLLSGITSTVSTDKPRNHCVCKCVRSPIPLVRSFRCYKNISNLGFAALMLMGKQKLCDVDNLLLWAANKQMKLEGGFQVFFI